MSSFDIILVNRRTLRARVIGKRKPSGCRAANRRPGISETTWQALSTDDCRGCEFSLPTRREPLAASRTCNSQRRRRFRRHPALNPLRLPSLFPALYTHQAIANAIPVTVKTSTSRPPMIRNKGETIPEEPLKVSKQFRRSLALAVESTCQSVRAGRHSPPHSVHVPWGSTKPRRAIVSTDSPLALATAWSMSF